MPSLRPKHDQYLHIMASYSIINEYIKTEKYSSSCSSNIAILLEKFIWFYEFLILNNDRTNHKLTYKRTYFFRFFGYIQKYKMQKGRKNIEKEKSNGNGLTVKESFDELSTSTNQL